MVKFNLVFLLLCACSLWTPVFGEDIDDISECRALRRIIRNQYANDDEETYASVESCITGDDDETMITLTLKGSNIQQKTIDEIAKYPSLEELNFNRVHEFEENISFESLNIDSICFNNLKYGRKINKFSNIYIQTGILKTLKNVKEVKIRATRISQTTLNELSTLTKLKKLTLDKCGYDKNLDFSVLKRAKQLTDLSLSVYGDENSITDSFSTLCQLRNLKNLNLRYLEINTLPKCIGNLTKLENLDLDVNDLTDLPSEFSKLTKLKKLRANYNSFKKIPSSICKLKNLQILMMTYNEITKIPNCIKNVKTLQSINLNFNEITEIPNALGELINLEQLSLSSNKINDTIPKSLNNLKKLKRIVLNHNINIKGKSLTNPTLETCIYTSGNEITNEFCINKNAKCISEYDDGIPQC